MLLKVQVAYRTSNRLDQERKSTCHHTEHKANIQNKETILKAARKRSQTTYKGRSISITPDFSVETLETRRVWTDVHQTLRDHRCQPILLYPAKLSITRDKGRKMKLKKVKHDKVKFKQYLSKILAYRR